MQEPLLWISTSSIGPAFLQEIGAPEDLIDASFWTRVHSLTVGTSVDVEFQLRRYLIWLESKPPSRQHRNHRRGYLRWLNKALESAPTTRARELPWVRDLSPQ